MYLKDANWSIVGCRNFYFCHNLHNCWLFGVCGMIQKWFRMFYNKVRIKRALLLVKRTCSIRVQHLYLRYYNVSRDKTPHFFRALAASCVLYNRTEHSQGFSICYKECSGMLRNLPECSMGLVLSMVLKPSAFFSLLYSLLRLTDFITDWFEIDLSIN